MNLKRGKHCFQFATRLVLYSSIATPDQPAQPFHGCRFRSSTGVLTLRLPILQPRQRNYNVALNGTVVLPSIQNICMVEISNSRIANCCIIVEMTNSWMVLLKSIAEVRREYWTPHYLSQVEVTVVVDSRFQQVGDLQMSETMVRVMNADGTTDEILLPAPVDVDQGVAKYSRAAVVDMNLISPNTPPGHNSFAICHH